MSAPLAFSNVEYECRKVCQPIRLVRFEEGVSRPAEVDHIFQIALGAHAGPFRLMDRVGLDVVLDIEEHCAAIHPELPSGPRELLKQYIREGRLGLKTGKKFDTDYGQKAPTVASEVRQSSTT